VAEKMQPGDGRVSDAALLATLQRHARAAEVFDMAALARETGTVISAVLLGAIAACGVLPFPREAYEATIRRSGRGVNASLAGFSRAYDRVATSRRQRAQAEQALQSVAAGLAPVRRDAETALPAAVRDAFPPAVHDMLALGHARVVDHQDARYGELYLQRVARVHDAERAGDPHATLGHATTRETARWLALWMAFDDIVRVAHLKLRAARAQRVRAEVGARDDELVKLYDHFKPGVPEFAALLPQAWARRLLGWDARRGARRPTSPSGRPGNRGRCGC